MATNGTTKDTEKALSLVEASSLDDAARRSSITEFVNPTIEKRLKLKLDLIVIPILTMTYLFNSLDRSNVSNAKTAGLSEDLGLVDNQFNLILTYYFIPFVLLGPVAGIATKRFTAKYTIPVMMLGFGSASLGSAFVHNYRELLACRIIVGAFESGFLTSVVYYLSLFYTRGEIASRIGIFYAALTSSSAFGGLISFGVFQMKKTGHTQWFYLFVIEGTLTLAIAIACFFLLPRDIRSAYFFTDEEKDTAEKRILADSVESLEIKFKWKEAITEFVTAHPYIRMITGITFGTVLNSNSSFLAIIVSRLGYDTVKTNLYTVAPSLVAAVFLIFLTFSSDHFGERGFHMVVCGVISIVGYILLITIDLSNTGVTYFAIFLTTVGAYPVSPLIAAWIVSNIPNLNARAFTTSVLISVNNCAGLISSNIFIANETPRYITALKVNLAFATFATIGTAAYSLWMRWENRKRDKVQHSTGQYVTSGVTGTTDLNFRFNP